MALHWAQLSSSALAPCVCRADTSSRSSFCTFRIGVTILSQCPRPSPSARRRNGTAVGLVYQTLCYIPGTCVLLPRRPALPRFLLARLFPPIPCFLPLVRVRVPPVLMGVAFPVSPYPIPFLVLPRGFCLDTLCPPISSISYSPGPDGTNL